MIDVEKLRNVKRLVTHANCPDGIASALIIKDALPDVEVVFMSHGTEAHRNLKPEPGMIFCDFTPYADPRDVLEEGQIKGDIVAMRPWSDVGAIVLDHHPTQRAVTEHFVSSGLGAYGENDRNECGAWLAYEHVWLPTYLAEHGSDDEVAKEVREFARLAGIRDTWKKNDPFFHLACEQAGILTFWGESLVERVGKNRDSIFGGGYGIEDTIFHPKSRHYLGRRLSEKQLEHANNALKDAHAFRTERGTHVLLFQGVTPTSDAAEILEKNANWKREQRDELRRSGFGVPEPYDSMISAAEEMEQPDIVAGFHYRVDAGKLQLQFSTRSHTGYDVASFCKSKGGGGHKAAAGFTVEQSAEVGANPYAVFRLLLDEWEQGQ